MSRTTALLIALALLAGNAFFVGAEFALISARRTQIEPRALAGSRAARVTLKAMENVSLMLAGAQLGITVCSLGLGALGEPAVAALIEAPFEAVGAPRELVRPVAFGIALAVVVFAHMVIGEMVPKNMALAGPERAALILGPALYGVVLVLRPIIWALNLVTNLILRLIRIPIRNEVTTAFTREEVAGFVAQSRQEGLLDRYEHDLLTGALEFADHHAVDVAIPIADLVMVPPTITVVQLEELCARTGYSRFPVRLDDGSLTGYVHLKDLLATPEQDRERPLDPARVRPLAAVTAQDPLRTVLSVMQRTGAHLARVDDPGTGQPAGVCALEDVLEELVGEVRDATQRPSPATLRTSG